MYSVRANILKNRLYVTLSGFIPLNEMKECTDKTIEEAKKLKPGYDVITDLSEFKTVSQETLGEVKRAQTFFRESGCRHGVRVVGKDKLASSQMDRSGKSVAYAPDSVETVADAEKMLDLGAVKIS
jgi:hypothetical protein